MDPLKVGGEVEAYCTSCKTMREHVIVAMVGARPAKVECVHCHKQHLYRAGGPGSAKAPSAPRAASRARRPAAEAAPAPAAVDLDALVAGREPRAYDSKARFTVGDAVRHPAFGVGVVTALPGPQKMDVFFRAGSKLLSHDRSAASTPTLVRPPRREEEERSPVTDAPPERARS